MRSAFLDNVEAFASGELPKTSRSGGMLQKDDHFGG